MPRKKHYGAPDAAARLAMARLSAGFGTARAAAVVLGVPPSTYQSHERATRAMGPDDVRRYAATFKVAPAWLTSGLREPPSLLGACPSAPASDTDRELTAMHFAGNRLAAARILAGFKTASEACRHFGLNRGSYGNHEYGRSALDGGWADLYALAYGTSAAWLLNGAGPSGHPPEAEALVRNAEQSARRVSRDGLAYLNWSPHVLGPKLARYADATRRGSPEAVAGMDRILKGRRSARSLVGRPGAMVVVGGTGPSVADASVAAEAWGFPGDFLRMELGAVPNDTFVVTATLPSSEYDVLPGDRLLVERCDADPANGLIVTERSSQVGVVTSRAAKRNGRRARAASGSDAKVLGRLVAVIRGVAGRHRG